MFDLGSAPFLGFVSCNPVHSSHSVSCLGAGSAGNVGDAVDEEEAPKGKLTYSYCCIDYARSYDAAQVRAYT